jgi:hypothetical protein
MKKISLAILLLHWLTAATAQQDYSKAVNGQIALVETSLSGGMVIDGKTYTLSERMKHYNVSGLSVAVIDNYQIVWAKGYGYAALKPRPGESRIFGRHLLETKDYDKAIAFLSKDLAVEPSDSSLVKNLAHSYLFKGDFTKAMEL